MQIANNYDDPLDKEIELDPKSFKKNPYATKFTPEEKFRAYLEAYIADNGWSKEHVREEVEAVLS